MKGGQKPNPLGPLIELVDAEGPTDSASALLSPEDESRINF
jgi:hypothetical protein